MVIGASLYIRSNRAVLQARSHQRQAILVKIRHSFRLIRCFRAMQAEMQAGIDKTWCDNPALHRNLQSASSGLQVFNTTSRPNGGNQAITNENGPILDNSKILHRGTTTCAAGAS